MNKFIKWITRSIYLVLLLPSNSFTQFNYQTTDRTEYQKSDVFLQGFYWNCTPGGLWWDTLSLLAPQIASAGFGAIWFPSPVKGMAGGLSMGYDPYDHYDFGEYNQSGGIETRFGSKQELLNAITTYHSLGLEVWADAVMNHMNGGEQKVPYECKPYPSFPDSDYLIFNYPNGSGRFKKNASYFYPNLEHCNVDQPYHGDPVFQFGIWLDHDKQKVKDSLIVWGQYLKNILGFDGFRLDAAKHMDPIFVGPWLQAVNSGHYAVAEYYGSIDEIKTWLHYCQDVFGGDVSMFDFPLRFDLKEMCNNTSGSYDMTWLDGAGLVNNGVSGFDVATFVENHDFDRTGWDGSTDIGHAPIIYDKHMGYAYILFSEGRPCVWFRDYFFYGLKGKIDTLIWIRQNFLYGSTTKRDGLNPWYVGSLDPQDVQAKDIYVARRNGGNGKPQAFLVINDNPTEWRGVWVNSNHPNMVFRDYTGVAIDKQAAGDGRVELWAPPRGYAIYIPDTTKHINHPPYIIKPPDQYAYVNELFEYQLSFGDPNNDSLSFQIYESPAWLSVSDSGKISGIPSASDTGYYNLRVKVTDPSGDTSSTIFSLNVVNHPIMDGMFEGVGIWGSPVHTADTLIGWDSTMAKEIYVTEDENYFYFGAKVRARQSMNWVFLINTKWGGGATDSWGRSILYNHYNKPDYVLRGLFTGYAELNVWNGTAWSNVGQGIANTEFGDNINSNYSQNGWVEARIMKSAIANPQSFAIQFYITGNQNQNATFDACPNDQNTYAWSGVTTRLNHYAYYGNKSLTNCNIQYPASAEVSIGDSITVFARVFGVGITDSSGQGSGVQAWIGYSETNNHPSNWTNWIPATYNLDVSGNDEYKITFGSVLPDGIYYYASRFRYGTSDYIYGGYSASGGGFWDSLNNISGRLRIYGPPAIPNLISPINGALNVSSTPSLMWSFIPNAQTYHLQVATDSSFTNIIFNDSTIISASKQIGPLDNNLKYFWRVKSKNINSSSSFSEIWSFEVNEVTLTFGVNESWNMVSLPLNIQDRRKSVIFPNANSRAFCYVPGIGYVIRDTLEFGKGYWVKFSLPESVSFTGSTITVDTINVEAGWNMIGSISTQINGSSLIQIPANNIRSPLFTYSNGYNISNVIQPSKAYWIRVDTVGKLILFYNGMDKQLHDDELINEIKSLSKIKIEDANHRFQKLYLSKIQDTKYNDNYFLLPPIPPPSSFDVRFKSGKMVENVDNGQSKSFNILISNAKYPLKVSYENTGNLRNVMLGYKKEKFILDNEPIVIINDEVDEITLYVGEQNELPNNVVLYQNYPNPFNPSTRIAYDIPFEAKVNLRVMNVLGQILVTLIDEYQQVGHHSIEWNPEGLASGLYFYKLDVIKAIDPSIRFTQVRKMIFQK
jgi:alpha-amylase